MAKYKVTAVNNPSDSYDIEADSLTIDELSNRHIFKDSDGNVVASELNVRVRKVED